MILKTAMDHKLNINQMFVLWKEAGISSGCILQYCLRKTEEGALLVTVPGGIWMLALETPNWERGSPFRESENEGQE